MPPTPPPENHAGNRENGRNENENENENEHPILEEEEEEEGGGGGGGGKDQGEEGEKEIPRTSNRAPSTTSTTSTTSSPEPRTTETTERKRGRTGSGTEEKEKGKRKRTEMSRRRRRMMMINTYHCAHCSQLLLATTHTLSALPTRRGPPSLDRAIILPLPPPQMSFSASSESESESESDSSGEEEGEEGEKERRRQRRRRRDDGGIGYSVMLSTTVDRRQVMVRKEDGFEKRAVLRCARCKVIMGYKLDEAQFGVRAGGGDVVGGDEGNNWDMRKIGREGRVVYLLRGGLVGTEDMIEGRMGAGELEVEVEVEGASAERNEELRR